MTQKNTPPAQGSEQTNATDPDNDQTLEQILDELKTKIGDGTQGADSEKITLGELLGLMHTKGIMFCILILALPSFFPGLLPPLPSILAVPMIFMGWQLVLNKDSVWLPQMISNLPIGRKVMGMLITKFVYYLNKLPVKKDLPPFLMEGKTESFIGVMIILFAGTMFIPLPFTNFLPSVGAAFVATGALKQSWIYVGIGLFVGISGVLVALFAIGKIASFLV